MISFGGFKLIEICEFILAGIVIGIISILPIMVLMFLYTYWCNKETDLQYAPKRFGFISGLIMAVMAPIILSLWNSDLGVMIILLFPIICFYILIAGVFVGHIFHKVVYKNSKGKDENKIEKPSKKTTWILLCIFVLPLVIVFIDFCLKSFMKQ